MTHCRAGHGPFIHEPKAADARLIAADAGVVKNDSAELRFRRARRRITSGMGSSKHRPAGGVTW